MASKLQTFQIADFALRTSFAALKPDIVDILKKHLLDSLGSLIHAFNKPAIKKLRMQIESLGENGEAIVPGGGLLPFDRAAQLYTALIRYPDFMDNYLGKEATCHPSDNIGSLLAASSIRGTTGKEFLTAMAVAYQIECRLVDEIPVMKEGIDHTLFLSYSIIASVSRLFGLTNEQTAHALGIGGCEMSPLATSRASYTYEWKGFASSLDAFTCMNIALLAKQNMTGPVELFEGPKGFKETFGMKLKRNWKKEKFNLIEKCILKPYNAEIHTMSAVEGAIELRNQNSFSVEDIKEVKVTTFLTAYQITGSGEYGDRKNVQTKEQADHSLFYLVAVALLDGDVYPDQFEPRRIKNQDVQRLLKKIKVRTKFPLHKPHALTERIDPYTYAYPDKVKAKIDIKLNNGKHFFIEKEDHEGFFTRRFSWDRTIGKFRRLADGVIDSSHQQKIIDAIKRLENIKMSVLLELIADIPMTVKNKARRESRETAK